MGANIACTVLIILICLIVIILIPLFLDLLFNYTVRSNRQKQILQLARIRSEKTGKPIIVFNDRYNGVVVEPNGDVGEEFKTDLVEAIKEMDNNSGILLISEALEYINPALLPEVISQLRKVSGGDLYVLGLERTAPRTIWDYKLKTLLDKPAYLPNEKISWAQPNIFQTSIQNVYRYIFMVIPYQFFATDPVIRGQTDKSGYA